MTDEKKIPKGVHDPWRMGTPAWAPPPSEVKKRRGRRHEQDPDADLKPDQRCVLRLAGQTGALIVRGTRDPAQAAAQVTRVVRNSPDLQNELERSGFSHGALGEINLQRFFFQGGDYLITHGNASPETYVRFVQVFLRFNRTPAGRVVLEKHGVTPVLAGG